MNCRPGDLAVVVKSIIPENIGLIVKVLCAAPPLDGMPAWVTESDRPTLTFSLMDPQIKVMSRIADAPDSHLRPIRPQPDDAVDEVIQRIGTPNKEIA